MIPVLSPPEPDMKDPCVSCAWENHWACNHPEVRRDPPRWCEHARWEGQPCGPAAKLFEPIF